MDWNTKLGLMSKVKNITYSIIHNCIAHPLLVIVDICDMLNIPVVSKALDKFYDLTAKDQ